MAPVKTTHLLHKRLVKEKVPAIMHILPQTDHAFDLILPKISPSAHNAFYDVERFLALQVKAEIYRQAQELNLGYEVSTKLFTKQF